MKQIALMMAICGCSAFGSLSYALPSSSELEHKLDVCREEYKELVNKTNAELGELKRKPPVNFPEIYKKKQKELAEKAASCKEIKFVLNYPKSLDDIAFPSIPEFGDIGNKTGTELEELGFAKDSPDYPSWTKVDNGVNIQVFLGLLSEKPNYVLLRFYDKRQYEQYRDNLVAKLSASDNFVPQFEELTEKNRFGVKYISEKISVAFADDMPSKRGSYSLIKFEKNAVGHLETANFLRHNPDVALSFNGLMLGISSIEDVKNKYAGKTVRKIPLPKDPDFSVMLTCSGNCNGLPEEEYSEYLFDETNTLCAVRIRGSTDKTQEYRSFMEVLKNKYDLDGDSEYSKYINRVQYGRNLCYMGSITLKIDGSVYFLEYSSDSNLRFKGNFDRLKKIHNERKRIGDII